MVAGGPLVPTRGAAALVAALALVVTVLLVLMLTGFRPFRNEPPAQVETTPSDASRHGPGVYTLTTRHGASITFEIPAPSPPDEDVEQLRIDLHVEPVTYVEMAIDNTKGTRPVEVRDLTIKGENEGLYPFYRAAEALVDWSPARTSDGRYVLADGVETNADQGAGLAARSRAAVAEYTDPVPAGQKGRELMIGDFERLPDFFAELQVSPHADEPPQSLSRNEIAPEQPGPRTPTRTPSSAGPDRPDAAAPEPAPLSPPRTPPPAAPPTAEPRPDAVFTPDCTDATQPTGPVQQTAWNAVCAPAIEPPPVPLPPAPAPADPAPEQPPGPVEPPPGPVEPGPVEPGPVEPGPVEPPPGPVEPGPVEPPPGPVEPGPVEPPGRADTADADAGAVAGGAVAGTSASPSPRTATPPTAASPLPTGSGPV